MKSTRNNATYKTFYPGSIREMLHNVEQYIENGVFCNDVVDLIVAAASKCLPTEPVHFPKCSRQNPCCQSDFTSTMYP